VPIADETHIAAGKVGAVAEIQALVVRRLHWTVNETAVDPNASIEPESTFNIAHGKTGPIVRYQINSSITGKVPAGELFRMESTHEAFFSVPEDRSWADLELEAYGKITVFFMVFPYIRETLQGLTVNAGLPPVLLRPMRLTFSAADVAPPEPTTKPVAPAAIEATSEQTSPPS
jgi:preprotein translocase subunit SecB